MNSIFFLFALIATLIINHNLFAASGTTKNFELKHDGINRTYSVYLPSGIEKKPTPVMLVLHGGTGSANHSIETMGFADVAEQEKFLVVFANGTGTLFGADRRVWNAGECCAAAVRKNIDDVGFIKKMLDELKTNYTVDSKRIYVTGMSNGAMMTYRLICELPNTFAAAIPVAGAIVVDKKCEHGANTAIMHIHGLKDESVPFLGGKSKGFIRAKYKPTIDTLNIFSKLKNCEVPKTTAFGNGNEVLDFSCGVNPPMKLVKIKNLQHAWPGGSGRRAQKDIDYSAPIEGWNFAKNFTLK